MELPLRYVCMLSPRVRAFVLSQSVDRALGVCMLVAVAYADMACPEEGGARAWSPRSEASRPRRLRVSSKPRPSVIQPRNSLLHANLKQAVLYCKT